MSAAVPAPAAVGLAPLGWDPAWAEALDRLDDPRLAPGRVTAVHRGRVLVRGEDEDRLLPVLGVAEPLLVGDWVGVREDAVRALLPRRRTLEREKAGLVANADTCLVVTSLDGDLNLRRIERFVALARAAGTRPVVLASKGDLSHDPEAELRRIAARTGSAEVLVLSVRDGWGIAEVRERLVARETHVLVGMSGVGKSTLVNLLLGEERQRTAEVRADDDRGRHATTHRELFVLPGGALLVDTPGVRSPGLATTQGLDELFPEVAALAEGCRFGDCRHDGEPGCAVRGAMDPERLASFHKLALEGRTAEEARAGQRGPTARRTRRDQRDGPPEPL